MISTYTADLSNRLQVLQYYMRRLFTAEDLSIFLIVLAVITLLPVLLCVLHFRPLVRTVAVLVFVVYLAGNASYTLLNREVLSTYNNVLPTLGEYHRAFYLDLGLQGTIQSLIHNGIRETLPHIHVLSGSAAREIFLNILLYIPMGYLLPFVFKPLRYSVLLCTAIGFLCSCATEYAQLHYHIGYFQVDDIINNTLGCLIGAILGCLHARLWRVNS